MAAVPLISLGVLFVGIAGSLVLLVRSGEIRAGWLAACLGLIAVHQAVGVWLARNEPLTLGASGIAEYALLAASAAAWFVLAGLWQSLAERDRAEALHWDSMEGVRVLSELAVRWDLNLEEKLDQLLGIGCARFDLEIAVVARVERERYEVLAIHAPEEFAVARGDVFLLADTWCSQALRADRPLGIERVTDAIPLPHAERAPFGFAAYLGSSVRVYGEVFGTVAFGSSNPRGVRFSATDKDFVQLMAQWIGTELERRIAVEEPMRENARQPAIPNASRSEAAIPRGVDVNEGIRRSAKNLRNLVGDRARIDYDLDAGLHPAENVHVGAGAIVENLVLAALDALPSGGRIAVATANLAFEDGGKNAVPTRSGQRHVTIAVVARGTDIATDAFSQSFESPTTERPTGEHWDLRPRMTVAQVHRLLRRRGGDLSLEVEPGVAATFTVYLPSAAGTTAACDARSSTALHA